MFWSGRRPSKAAPSRPTRDRCTESSCGSRDALRCGYVDRRGRRCDAAWCLRHRDGALDGAFCRRHASTLSALGGVELAAGLPDLDNRAPSLVGWIGREVDQPVRAALLRQATNASRLIVDPVHFTARSAQERRWHRRWRLVDHTGVLRGVAIEVDEGDDARVITRVDSRLIGERVPPWIERRRLGLEVSAERDAEERRLFREALIRSIELVVRKTEVS
jgi:hypothetical protein